VKVNSTTVIDKRVHALVSKNSLTALSSIVNRKMKNCNECNCYFYHINLGHNKLGYYI